MMDMVDLACKPYSATLLKFSLAPISQTMLEAMLLVEVHLGAFDTAKTEYRA